MLEEFGGHHRADGVAAQVLGAGRAASVPVEAGERVGATRLKLAAEHISVTHSMQYPHRARRSASWRRGRRLILRRPGRVRPGQARAGGLVLTVWSVKTSGIVVPRLRMAPWFRRRPGSLDRGELELALRPFGESTMLPRAAYTDPEVFAWEQQNFFGGGWTCVGLSSLLAQPGDQRAEARAGQRAADQGRRRRLHAFANTCRHRGHELLGVGETAQRNTVICPYHSWTYSCTARCASPPGSSPARASTGPPGGWPSCRSPNGTG